MCVSEIPHEMVFAGGETDSYRDSGLAWLRRGVGGVGVVVDGGVVTLTLPPFTQVLSSSEPRKIWRKSKRQKNK